MEEAMVYDGLEMGSIESWRRGIADVERQSVSTSVDGEFITPEAARRKKEHIRERAKEERKKGKSRKAESVISERTERSERTVRRVGSESTIRQRDIPIRSSSSRAPTRALTMPSESGRSERSERTRKTSKKGKELVVSADKEKKSALSIFLKKHKEKGKSKDGSERSHSRSHRPKMLEM